MDLLPNDETSMGTVFPHASAVPPFVPLSSGGRRRRRAAGATQPRPTEWADCFAANAPILVRAAPEVAAWPALAWTREYLETHMPEVRAHVSLHRTVQMMSIVQPLGRLRGLEWQRQWTERNISVGALMQGGGGADRSEWPYYFAPVSTLPSPLRNDLRGAAALSTPFVPIVETNLWVGAPGVSSPLHYDVAHNVFAQLRGHKRFLLFPPELTDSL